MKSLGLVDAAALLRIHPNTLQQRARAGLISGSKIGRAWVFLEDDLVSYIRAGQENACHSTNKHQTARGGSASHTLTHLGYVDQLERLIAKKRSVSTTNSRQSYGT